MSSLNTRPITPTPSTFAIARFAKALKFGPDFAETHYRHQPHVANSVSDYLRDVRTL
jgi:hypothetical protein